MFPLLRATESNPTMGGYGYGDWSDFTHSYHPAIDFNSIGPGDADLGDALIAVCTMRLENESYAAVGFGRHQWWSVVDGPHKGKWLHYAHANSFIYNNDNVGHIAHRGERIGECGKSGGQAFAHLHFEVKRQKPPSWGYGGNELRNKDEVDAIYMNPLIFCSDYDKYAENVHYTTNSTASSTKFIPGDGDPYHEASPTANDDIVLDIEDLLKDLNKWMVETFSYADQLWQGYLVVPGNSDIKVGQELHIEDTGEEYYVESVEHSWAVYPTPQFITRIGVSRGILPESFIPSRDAMDKSAPARGVRATFGTIQVGEGSAPMPEADLNVTPDATSAGGGLPPSTDR